MDGGNGQKKDNKDSMNTRTEKFTKESFQSHIQEEHKLTVISSYIREIVYGGNDGIVTTFAVVSGFTGAHQGAFSSLSISIVLLFGLANLFADATAMGLGNFLAIRANKDMFNLNKAKELEEITHSPDSEKKETEYLLTSQGFTESQAKTLTEIISTNKEFWADFMMQYELEMPDANNENEFYTATATFVSFIIFGAIPLLPYLFKVTQHDFLYSCVFTAIALLILGAIRGKVSQLSIFKSAVEVLIIGSLSASIAYGVGLLFRGMG